MKTFQKPENLIWNPKMECMPREEINGLQLARLQHVVQTAWHHQPFYRNKMQALHVTPEQIRSLDDLRRLPLTTKDDLRHCFPYDGFAVPMDQIVRIHASSGTTGQATVVGYTRGDLDRWSECMARLHTAAGITRHDIVQIVMGYGFFTGGLGHHYGIEKIGASVLPVSAGKSERQIRIMCDYATTALIATPSYALRLAELAETMGLSHRLKLRLGLFGSEAWGEEMRRQLQQTIGVFATDNYGLSEVQGPGVSYECIQQNGMHFAEDHFLPELIDPSSGEPAQDPFNQGGELVITTLTKEGIPLIRYRTRDLCHFLPGTCPCGRTTRRMSKVSARSDDMLIIRGVNVFPQQIEKALLSVPGTAPHYQIIVTRPGALDELEVQVEATLALFADQMRKQQEVIRQIQEKLLNDVLVRAKIRLVEPGTLPRFEGKASRVHDLRTPNMHRK